MAFPGYPPQQPFTAPGAYPGAPAQAGFTLPSQGYAPPPAQAGFAAPPAQGYAPPPAQGYAPPPAQGYAPPPAQGYAPPPSQGYAPPPAQGYAPPPAQGYAPPPAQGYAPLPAQGYAPPPAQGYAPPPAQGSSVAPPVQGSAHTPTHSECALPSPDGAGSKKFNPTIRAKQPYGSSEIEADAAALRMAMKGLGTDEKAIIAVLANRTNDQRQQIMSKFTALYSKDLVKNLKSELSGNLEDTAVACMTPLDQYLAKELHDAMARIGTTDSTLIEILCSMNNTWIQKIKKAYQQKYNTSVETDIEGDTSGSFKRLLIALCHGLRDENPQVDASKVSADVQSLYLAGENKIGTDESVFISILTTRSVPHLREVFNKYQQMYRTPIKKVLESEFSGCVKSGLKAIAMCITDCPAYFAKRLHESMAGAGTRDRALIRVIVSRSECDLGDIKVAMQNKYGKSLESYIEGDCSGYYKKMLIAMITPN